MDTREIYSVCINLNDRKDRWEETVPELSRLGFRVGRFPAVRHKDPIIGCASSHFAVLEEGLCRNQHTLIFEDDVHFLSGIENLNLYLDKLDTMDWAMLYLGANVTSPIYPENELMGRLTSAQSTHAYMVNREFIQVILSCEPLIGKHMDLIYSEHIVPSFRCYITIPMLAVQRPSFSDIENKKVDYSWMEERYRTNLERK